MRLLRQFQAFFFFFFKKILCIQKCESNQNQPTKQKQAQTKELRQQFFTRTKTSKRVKVICFGFWYFFACKIFLLKKINRSEIVLMASFYYTTDGYPYQPAYEEFICMHLCLQDT